MFLHLLLLHLLFLLPLLAFQVSDGLFPLLISLDALVDILLGLDSFRIFRIPIFIVSLEQADGEIQVIDDVLDLCHNLLVDLVLLLFPLGSELLGLIETISHMDFLPLDLAHHPNNLRVQHFVDIVKLLVVALEQSPHLQVGLVRGNHRVVGCFLPAFCHQLEGLLYFRVVRVFCEDALQCL